MTSLLITLLFIILIFGVAYAIIIRLPLPDPFNWIAQLVLLLLLLFVLLSYVLPLIHEPFFR